MTNAPEVTHADDRLQFATNALELNVLGAIGDDDLPRLRHSAASAFHIARVLGLPDSPTGESRSARRA